MRILVENKIQTLTAGNLSEYDGGISQHGTSVMLNDYPTAQWISNIPDGYEVLYDNLGNPSGRLRVSSLIVAEGVTSMNGIYLGNFNGDGINYQVWQDNRAAGDVNPVWNSIGSEDAPIRVFPSFGHFVRGRPNAYTDYLYTLNDLGFSSEYLYTDFKIDVTISSEINLLIRNDVSFHINKITRLPHSDIPDATTGTKRIFWKLHGNFKNSSGEILRLDDEIFSEDLAVGNLLLLELSGDNQITDGAQAERMCQTVEIKGNGGGEDAFSLLVRSYETEGVQSAMENFLTTIGVSFVNADTSVMETAVFPSPLVADCTYIWTSMRIGLFRAGYIEHFPNPQVGLSRTYRDFSIRKSLVNGGHQYSNRNMAKIYSGSLVLDRDRVRRFLTFAEYQRAKPFPVEILSNIEEETPTVYYGFFTQSPSESMSQRLGTIRDISFSIQQVF